MVLGGVLFKVYIVGEAIKVVRRFSLPDVSKRELKKNAGVYRFPRVSCAAASADEADLDPSIAGEVELFCCNMIFLVYHLRLYFESHFSAPVAPSTGAVLIQL